MSDGLVSFKLEGLNALQEQLVGLGAEVGVKALAQAARQAFKPVLETAKSLVPRDSGELHDALRLSVKKPKSGEEVVTAGIRIGGGNTAKGLPPARRWHWIEFGTAHTAAHPFLRTALDQNAGAVLGLLQTEIAKSIQKAIKKKASGK